MSKDVGTLTTVSHEGGNLPVLYLTPMELRIWLEIGKLKKTSPIEGEVMLPSNKNGDKIRRLFEVTPDAPLTEQEATFSDFVRHLEMSNMLEHVRRSEDYTHYRILQNPDDFLIVELPASGRMCVETAPEYVEIVNRMLAGEGPDRNGAGGIRGIRYINVVIKT